MNTGKNEVNTPSFCSKKVSFSGQLHLNHFQLLHEFKYKSHREWPTIAADGRHHGGEDCARREAQGTCCM